MRLTPPQNLKQGQERTKKDITYIFNPVSSNQLRNKRIAAIVRTGNRNAWDKFAQNIKRSEFSDTIAVIPNYGLHKLHRNKRGRAIRKRNSPFVTLEPDQKQLQDYILKEQNMVGWARAGWLPTYLGLNGTRAAAWVKRHAPGSGNFTDARNVPNSPFIAGYNTTSWARRSDEADRIMQNALRARAAAMKRFFEATMEVAKSGQLTQWQTKMRALAAAE